MIRICKIGTSHHAILSVSYTLLTSCSSRPRSFLMALALSTSTSLAQVMPSPSSMNSELDYRIVVSAESRFETTARHRDAHLYGYEGLTPIHSPLSPEESEEDLDMPMSPITFGKNEIYERSRLSYVQWLCSPQLAGACSLGCLLASRIHVCSFFRLLVHPPAHRPACLHTYPTCAMAGPPICSPVPGPLSVHSIVSPCARTPA